jgi:hypothetical protein
LGMENMIMQPRVMGPIYEDLPSRVVENIPAGDQSLNTQTSRTRGLGPGSVRNRALSNGRFLVPTV